MTAIQMIDKAQDLPVISQAALKLPHILSDQDSSNDHLVQTLKCDPVLTAKLLRACNSASVASWEPITSVDQAVLMLGNDAIFKMVCALGYGPAMGGSLEGYGAAAFELWNHSMYTACAAESLARYEFEGRFKPCLAFTAGLLHDIGKLVLNQALTKDIQSHIRGWVAERKTPQVDAERFVLGTDHGEVGALLLKRWRLPDTLVEAVGNHHHPVTKPSPNLSAVVHLADDIVHLLGIAPGWDSFALRADPGVAEAVGLRPERVAQIMVRIHGTMNQVDSLLATHE